MAPTDFPSVEQVTPSLVFKAIPTITTNMAASQSLPRL